MKCKKKSAYIWTREHSPERLNNLKKIQRYWSVLLDKECSDHYQPIQYLPSKTSDYRETYFDALMSGVDTRIHLKVFTTKLWFIREVYKNA